MSKREPVSSVATRWTALPSGSRRLLLAVVLHQRALPVAWVDRITDDPEDVDRLLDEQLLSESKSGLFLADGVDATDIHGLASWSQRRRTHLQLAEVCRETPRWFEQAGEHFRAAGQDARAATCYLAAGELACRRHHHRIAMRCLTEGLRLIEPTAEEDEVVRSIQGLERCTRLSGKMQSTIALLQDWRTAPAWRDRPRVQIAAGLALASLLAGEGRNVESARERTRAAQVLIDLGQFCEGSTAALAAAETLTYSASYIAARRTARIAVQAAETSKDPELTARSTLLLGLILGMLGETEAGRSEIERCLEIAHREQLSGIAAEAYRLLGTVTEYASCYADEATAFATALTFCHRHKETETAGMCLGCISYSYLRAGDWKRSEKTAREVARDETLPDYSRSIAECVLGLLCAYRGDMRTAIKYLHLSLERTRSLGLLVMDFLNLFGLALVAEAKGRGADAAELYASILERWRATDDRHDAIPGLTGAVAFYADHGRRDEAAGAAEALATIASLTANPEAKGAAQLAAGEILCLDGFVEKGIESMRKALSTYDQRALSVEPIGARMRLARALLKHGSHGEAGDLLKECRTRARNLGARTLIVRLDAIQAGSPSRSASGPPTADPATWDLLSARQREVARHLVKGRTNKEMAGHLSVSVRTVDMHVAHILARLDCRTRAEAAARIGAALG